MPQVEDKLVSEFRRALVYQLLLEAQKPILLKTLTPEQTSESVTESIYTAFLLIRSAILSWEVCKFHVFQLLAHGTKYFLQDEGVQRPNFGPMIAPKRPK